MVDLVTRGFMVNETFIGGSYATQIGCLLLPLVIMLIMLIHCVTG